MYIYIYIYTHTYIYTYVFILIPYISILDVYSMGIKYELVLDWYPVSLAHVTVL